MSAPSEISRLFSELQSLEPKKIVIVGPPGSGKSTLGRSMAQKLGIPHIEVSHLFWQPNGDHLSEHKFRAAVTEKLESSPHWVCEGHFKDCHSLVLPQCSLVIEINRSFWESYRYYVARDLARTDISLKQKLKQILFVPLNVKRIQQTRRSALAGFPGRIVTVGYNEIQPDKSP
jgi:hypothetical protein